MNRIISLICICSLVCSCTYKDLCWDHSYASTVDVAIDWESSRQEEAKEKVRKLCIDFNHLELRKVLGYELHSPEGGRVRLESGEWKALARNSNASVQFIMEDGLGRDSETGVFATSRTSTLEEATLLNTRAQMPRGDERIALMPDPLWAAESEVFRVEEEKDGSVCLCMNKRTSTVHITIKDVSNIQYAGAFGASLSGLAGGICISDGRQGSEAVTMAIPLHREGESSLCGTLECFGHSPSTPATHILTIYSLLGDGSKWYSSIDVSSELDAQGDELSLSIIVDSLPLPKPIVNGSGFQPAVDSWQEVNIYVSM